VRGHIGPGVDTELEFAENGTGAPPPSFLAANPRIGPMRSDRIVNGLACAPPLITFAKAHLQQLRLSRGLVECWCIIKNCTVNGSVAIPAANQSDLVNEPASGARHCVAPWETNLRKDDTKQPLPKGRTRTAEFGADSMSSPTTRTRSLPGGSAKQKPGLSGPLS
jgi:hypothetical protein